MIRYSEGTIFDELYTSDGTKTQMVDQISTALETAGWDPLGSHVFQSATTPAGFKIRVDVIAGTTCVNLHLKSPTLTNNGVGDGAFLFPVVDRVFRIWANKYQLFHFKSGTTYTLDPCDVAFGVQYTPPFFIDSDEGHVAPFDPWCGWMVCNGSGNPGFGSNHLNSIGFHGRFDSFGYSIGSMWFWDGIAFYDTNGGDITYLIGQISKESPTLVSELSGFWEDGSVSLYEPYLAWPSGHTTSQSWSSPLRKGQLWDAMCYGDLLASEVTVMIDDKNWRNITATDTGSPVGRIPHSLLLLTS